MLPETDRLLRRIAEALPYLHRAGTLSLRVLTAVAEYVQGSVVRHSVETGVGASTLLLSHLSDDHTVFCWPDDESTLNVKRSPLLRLDAVTFIEGPVQKTIPQHIFSEPLDLVLLDGPHGESVGAEGSVAGSAHIPAETHIWVLVRKRDYPGWWPQGGGPAVVADGLWKISVRYGEPKDAGAEFEVRALAVEGQTHDELVRWCSTVARRQSIVPPVSLPEPRFVLAEDYVVVKKIGLAAEP